MVTEKQRKILSTALKLAISALLIYFIFSKIDFNEVVGVLKKANFGYLLIALLFFTFSKVLNAMRLNLFFHAIDIQLTQWSNIQLYLLGMFYNLFLPGGIGGDAYKGYVIKKRFEVPTKRVVWVLILDRLNGMLLIFVFACVLGCFIPNAWLQPFKPLFVLAIPVGVLVFWWVHKVYFQYTKVIFWKATGYSALLQTMQLCAVFFILKAFEIGSQELAFLFIFLISSIVSVVPLTLGGIGSREVTFLYGSNWLILNPDTAIAVSFVFFLLTAFVSFIGMVYHIRKPELIISGGD